MNIAERLKELRIAAGVTQKELASSTGIALQSIINYENGRREPNSKAMVALERYFNVSGEFLRGEVDRTTFFENSDMVLDGLDQVVAQFLVFRTKYLISNQDEQLFAASVLAQMIELITENLLLRNTPVELTLQEIVGPLSAVFDLNAAGRTELSKRADELRQLSQYKK